MPEEAGEVEARAEGGGGAVEGLEDEGGCEGSGREVGGDGPVAFGFGDERDREIEEDDGSGRPEEKAAGEFGVGGVEGALAAGKEGEEEDGRAGAKGGARMAGAPGRSRSIHNSSVSMIVDGDRRPCATRLTWRNRRACKSWKSIHRRAGSAASRAGCRRCNEWRVVDGSAVDTTATCLPCLVGLQPSSHPLATGTEAEAAAAPEEAAAAEEDEWEEDDSVDAQAARVRAAEPQPSSAVLANSTCRMGTRFGCRGK